MLSQARTTSLLWEGLPYRFATITENFEEVVRACDNIWREGFAGERLIFRRLE